MAKRYGQSAEYKRLWRAKKKAEFGASVDGLSTDPNAIYMREWRKTKKVKIAKKSAAEHQKAYRERTKVTKPTRAPQHLPSEEELMAQVIARGRVLSAMMRTPMCMWPAEWTEDV